MYYNEWPANRSINNRINKRILSQIPFNSQVITTFVLLNYDSIYNGIKVHTYLISVNCTDVYSLLYIDTKSKIITGENDWFVIKRVSFLILFNCVSEEIFKILTLPKKGLYKCSIPK